MGAWGSGPFENDDALDWLGELDEPSDLREALKMALEDDDYKDVDIGAQAIAAAEMVAAWKTKDTSRLHEDASAWLESNPKAIGDKDVPLAARAVRAVMDAESSEIAALWDEGGTPNEWRDAAEALLKKLE